MRDTGRALVCLTGAGSGAYVQRDTALISGFCLYYFGVHAVRGLFEASFKHVIMCRNPMPLPKPSSPHVAASSLEWPWSGVAKWWIPKQGP